MHSSLTTLSLLIISLVISACGTRPSTPTAAAPTSIATTATLPSIVTLPAPSITPSPTVLPPATAVPSPTLIASPIPKITTISPISITLFTIEPSTIDPGDAITLTWQATGGQVNLFPINPLGQMELPFQVSIAGSMVYTTNQTQRNFMQFMLNAHDSRLNTDLQAFASVTIRCPDVWFFANGPSSCPQSPPIRGNAAIEHFQHGFMIWLQPHDSIYILYGDDQFSPKWDLRQDNFVDGQPESDPSLVPPKGMFQPIRGFGLVWRDENTILGWRVRDRLGWALDEERAFQGTLQCNSAVKYITCYLKDDRGRTIELKPERSAWNYWRE
jgi:hypothetical protein